MLLAGFVGGVAVGVFDGANGDFVLGFFFGGPSALGGSWSVAECFLCNGVMVGGFCTCLRCGEWCVRLQ